MAKRNRKRHEDPYSSALFEVTLVAIAAPCLAVFSCVLITSLKWAPNFGWRWHGLSPTSIGLIIAALAFLGGGVLFARRFRRYREDDFVWQAFDTENDRRVVFWQKVAILTGCGLVVPWVALALTIWVI